MSASAIFCQTSTGSTQPTDRAKLISLCENATEEVKILRPLIKEAETAVKAAETALEDERRAGSLTAEQLAERTREVENLRAAYEKLRTAFEEKEAEVEIYKKALKGAIKKKNFFKTIAKYSTTAAVILGAVVVLQNK